MMGMVTESLRINVDDDTTVTGALDYPQECKPGVTPGLVLAHGAANDLHHPLLAAVAQGLASRGAAIVIRFNFPYRERGASSPSSMDSLTAAYRRAHDTLMDREGCYPGPVFLGGKSLGAKVAAELVSRHHEGEGLLGQGLVFLGFPLHAPDKERIRTGSLRRIGIPSLFVEGTKDPFCDLELLRPVVEELAAPGRVFVVEGGGHSMEVPESAGRSQEEVYASIVREITEFMEENTARSTG